MSLVSAKVCATCKAIKALDLFFRQKSSRDGRHSYCKACYSKRYIGRKRNDPPENRRDRNYRSRYGLSAREIAGILAAQGGKCLICGVNPKKACVDHCHVTGLVRGILCSRCNVLMAAIDDTKFFSAAIKYRDSR